MQSGPSAPVALIPARSEAAKNYTHAHERTHSLSELTLENPSWVRRYLQEYLTLEEVGEMEGITREGVRQRLKALGIEPRAQGETAKLRERREISLRGEEIRSEFLRTLSIAETADRLGLRSAWVRRFVEENIPDFEVLLRVPRLAPKKYSEADLQASLREAASLLKGNLTAEAYDKFARSNGILVDLRPRPGMQVMALRYGSWRAALEAAGLPANPHAGPNKGFDVADAVSAIVKSWRTTGHAPTVTGYDHWQREHAGHPSSATVRKLTGSWNELMVRAWQVVHGIPLDQDDESVAVPLSLLADAKSTTSDALVTYYAADEGAEFTLSGDMVAGNYLALERAVRSHAQIQNAIAGAAPGVGLTPWSPAMGGPAFDIALSHDDGRVFVVEVKSATIENLEFQLRIGLGQVLRYAHQLRTDGCTLLPVIALELEPDNSWTDMLHELGVGVLVTGSIREDLERFLNNTSNRPGILSASTSH